jgi:hypothetical protein
MRREHGAKCTCPAAPSCVAGFDPAYGCESTVVASIAKTHALHWRCIPAVLIVILWPRLTLICNA